MYYVAAFILGMFLFAVILDYVLKEDASVAWKKASAEWWSDLGEERFDDMIVSANRWFLGLFDAIYGDRMLSWKRTYRSILSSYLAVGLTSIFWANRGALEYLEGDWRISALLIALLNLVPDYLSLQETRWIMRLSQGRKIFGLWALGLLDLVLTTAIFLTIGLVAWPVVFMFLDGIEANQIYNYLVTL